MIQTAVIGAGPAGISCALQLRRYGLSVLLFEKNKIGGLIHSANKVENYLGFPKGISGQGLAELLSRHAQEWDIIPIYEEVYVKNYEGGKFHLQTKSSEYSADILVIATGTVPVKLTCEGADSVIYNIEELTDKSGKDIAIIGGGDAAFDYALNLSTNNRVTILNRSDRLKCLPLLWQRALKSKNIKYIDNIIVEKIYREKNKLLLSCNLLNIDTTITVDYICAAVGRTPDESCLSDDMKAMEEELIRSGKLHKIGDVSNGIYRQAAISSGDGIRAAMQIYRKTEGK